MAQYDWATMTPEERDRLVAERVMGEPVGQCKGEVWHSAYHHKILCDSCSLSIEPNIPDWANDPEPNNIPATHIVTAPNYTTDMTAVWRVVRKMREHPEARVGGLRIPRNLHLVEYAYNRAYAAFALTPTEEDYSEANGEHCTEEAICLAALRAAGGSVA